MFCAWPANLGGTSSIACLNSEPTVCVEADRAVRYTSDCDKQKERSDLDTPHLIVTPVQVSVNSQSFGSPDLKQQTKTISNTTWGFLFCFVF